MLWLAVLITGESFRSRMDGLQPAVLPFAAICAIFPVLFPQSRLIAHADAWGFKLHFLTAMLAYSLFTLSALHAGFMSIVERKLHQKSLSPLLASLPPPAMETLLFRLIGSGFILLTVALGSGVPVLGSHRFGKAMTIDHKSVFAVVSWLIFAMIVGRQCYGWRGRIALRWTMTVSYFSCWPMSEVVL